MFFQNKSLIIKVLINHLSKQLFARAKNKLDKTSAAGIPN